MTHEFEKIKKEYRRIEMSKADVKQMKAKIRDAEAENHQTHKAVKGWVIGLAVAVMLCILPNTNVQVAEAMGNIPVIGGFFSLITIREYKNTYQKSEADVDVSGLQSKNKTGQKTAKEVNKDIRRLTNQYIAEYKSVTKSKGLENLKVDSKVIAKTKHYFTLKLTSTRSAADSYEEDHYYTISLDTGKRISLNSLFKKNADYQTVLKNNVKKQMLSLAKKDKNKIYWVANHDPDFKESDLTTKASFYLNKKGNIVICYNQGDVAPMYMGTQQFEIPHQAVKDILK